MNLITSFITHSVQPGTSFAATPTLSLFKELYGIATRLVARAPSQSSQKMKRLPESSDTAQPDFISSSRVPHISTITHSETDITVSNPSPAYNGQQIPEGDQDVQSNSSAKSSQESTGGSPLKFAPFIPPEPSQFDYDPTIYDSLLSPTRFEWDMANMWMPSFAPDLWTSADLVGLQADASLDYGQGYFDENYDGSNAYQQ
jgi:hypothetical protein